MYYSEEEQKKIRQAQDETVRRIGREEGFAEGQAKGREEANRETARNLLALGVDVQIIARSTGLSAEEIATL